MKKRRVPDIRRREGEKRKKKSGSKQTLVLSSMVSNHRCG